MGRPNGERYRALAAECAAIAEKATDPRIKAFKKAEADSWLRLAELMEKQRGQTFRGRQGHVSLHQMAKPVTRAWRQLRRRPTG
jgi:hypothetical protein